MWSDTSPNLSLNVCRLCANLSDIVIPIFGKHGEKERLDLKIKKCLPIAVQEEDFKPKQVCLNCASKLETCVDFIEMCLRSEYKFNSVLQTRYPGLKTADSGQNSLQLIANGTKESELDEAALGVVPLIQQASKQIEETSNNTLAVSQEGGVIVLSKVDGDMNTQQREDCQDILLMVELKYNKDLPDSQQAAVTKAHAISYTVDNHNGSIPKMDGQPYTLENNKTHAVSFPATVQIDAKAPTLSYTVCQQQISKSYSITYPTDPKVPVIANHNSLSCTGDSQPIVVSKAFNFVSDQQDNSIANKSQSMSYSSTPNDVDTEKTHSLIFAESQPIQLTKDSLTFTEESVQPVALIKSDVLAYTKDQDSEGSLKNEEVFVANIPEDDCDKRQNLANMDECLHSDKDIAKQVKIMAFPCEPKILLEEDVPSDSPEISDNQLKEIKVSDITKQDKPFPCNICGKSFMRRTNLNVHMAVHTQIRPHECDQCGKRFVLKWDLTLHQRIHTGLFSCEFCGKAFSVRGKLERHRRIHTGERPFACLTCGKAFSDKRNLETHTRTHSGERPFVCHICSRSFRVRSHLSDHQRVHSQDTPYTCDTCGKSFKWKTNLNIHLKVHSGERFPCDECGREFGRRADLIKHQRTHNGDRPHVCGLCSKSYGDKAMLQKHLKCHSDHKPFSCDICGKSFHFHWYLNNHRKIHCEDKGKSFSCQMCDKVFNKRGNLFLHMKASHHSHESQVQRGVLGVKGGSIVKIEDEHRPSNPK